MIKRVREIEVFALFLLYSFRIMTLIIVSMFNDGDVIIILEMIFFFSPDELGLEPLSHNMIGFLEVVNNSGW